MRRVVKDEARRVKRAFFCSLGVFVLTAIAGLLLRLADLAPSAAATAVGGVAIYSMGASVYFGVRLWELQRLAGGARDRADHVDGDRG